jgi:hypothetical protein
MKRFSIIIGTLAFALFGVIATPRAHEFSAAVVAPASAVRDVTIPAGTPLRVRLNSTISTAAAHVEQPVSATLIAPLRIDGALVAPAGSQLNGYLSSVRRSGKVKGRASLAVRFTRLVIAGRDESYPIAAGFSRIAPATKKNDAMKIGIPAAGGAVIGGLVGGKKGVATGAAVGGGAGTAVVLTTRGKEVVLPRGSIASVRLQHPVNVRVETR